MHENQNMPRVDPELKGLAGILLKIGQRQERIIAKIKIAVERGDRDEVFALATELVAKPDAT